MSTVWKVAVKSEGGGGGHSAMHMCSSSGYRCSDSWCLSLSLTEYGRKQDLVCMCLCMCVCRQTEIAKRLNAICAQIIPFLSIEVMLLTCSTLLTLLFSLFYSLLDISHTARHFCCNFCPSCCNFWVFLNFKWHCRNVGMSQVNVHSTPVMLLERGANLLIESN